MNKAITSSKSQQQLLVKERPILFNSELVRSILDGRKTQTRRALKPKHPPYFGCGSTYDWVANCPFGLPGDQLWVKEKWGFFDPSYEGNEWIADRPFKSVREMKFGKGYVDGNVIWGADGPFAWADPGQSSMEEITCWKPSIHMPRWASRILLEISNVRVERLNQITKADAIAEGFEGRGHFFKTWQSIYSNVHENPWVWVIEFERVNP
jgi:hypothetical protein